MGGLAGRWVGVELCNAIEFRADIDIGGGELKSSALVMVAVMLDLNAEFRK